MEQNISRAKQCGQRCRRIRQAKGISQQALANRVHTTPQNISKYEKEGISNIDMIETISNVLGQDLLKDEIDEEGVVGEVGKRIISWTVANGGHGEMEYLYDNMYGMSQDRINNEIFKLERIGMCVREQYEDFDGKDRDVLFITAKGMITYENMDGSNKIERGQVKSYEQILRGADDYQDMVDRHDAAKKYYKLLNKIDLPNNYMNKFGMYNISVGYRCNFIMWLGKQLYTGINNLTTSSTINPQLIPAKGFYHDLLFDMALGIGRDYYKYKLDEFNEEISVKRPRDEQDIVEVDAEHEFYNEFHKIYDFESEETDEPVAEEQANTEINDEEEEWDVLDTDEGIKSVFRNIADYHREDYNDYELTYPTDWFTSDEIKKYIEHNLVPQTEEEHVINTRLSEIVKASPWLLVYYLIPDSWEENGIADRVREIYGLPDGDADIWKEIKKNARLSF